MSLLNFYSLVTASNYILGYGTQSIVSIINTSGGIRQMTVLYRPDMKIWAGVIASKLEMPVLLNVRQYPSRDIRLVGDPNNIILILDEALTVRDVLNCTLRYHDTIYIMLARTYEEVEARLKECWVELVVSAYVLLISDTIGGQLYGFEPIPNGIMAKKMQRLETVKLFDGHGAPVNVSVVDIPPAVVLTSSERDLEGFEGRLVKEVVKKLNFRGQYAKARDGERWGWIEPAPAGVIGEVLTGYSAFGFGVLAATADRLEVMDLLAGYTNMECVRWAVPKGAGAAAPVWIAMLVTEYAWDTWLGLIVSSIAILIAYTIVDGSGIFQVLFRIFSVSIGAPIPLPLKTAARILTIVWVWASFIIAIAYQASMGSKLAVPPVKPDIDTYADLLSSGLEVHGLHNPITLMTDEDPQLHALKIRSIHSDKTLASLIVRMSTDRDLVYMRQGTTLRYFAAQHPLEVENIHLTSSCAVKYQHAIIMNRWSPFFRATEKIVQWLMEFGLIGKWEKDFMPEFHSISRPSGALGMKHLKGVFIMLTVGHGISAIAFLSELSWKKIKSLSNKNKSKPKRIEVTKY